MYICILNLTTPVEVMAKVCVILDHPSLNLALIGQAVSEEKMFEIVDADDDDHDNGRRRMGLL